MSVELTFAQSAPRRTGLAAWLSARPTAREGVLLGLVLAVLTCLPVLVAKYPQLERGENAFLQRYYEFDWKWSGNLGADLLVQPLAALFGLEAAGRIIAGLVPLLTALGILAVEWSLRRRIGLASLLALCFVWSPSLILGFLNFGLAQAAALFAFAAWVRLEDKPWRPLLFMPLGVLVWVLHVSGWGMLGILVFGYEWHRRKDLSAFFAPWPLFLPFASLFLGDNPSGLPSYGAKVWIFKSAIWKQAMRDGIVWLDHASLLLVGRLPGAELERAALAAVGGASPVPGANLGHDRHLAARLGRDRAAAGRRRSPAAGRAGRQPGRHQRRQVGLQHAGAHRRLCRAAQERADQCPLRRARHPHDSPEGRRPQFPRSQPAAAVAARQTDRPGELGPGQEHGLAVVCRPARA